RALGALRAPGVGRSQPLAVGARCPGRLGRRRSGPDRHGGVAHGAPLRGIAVGAGARPPAGRRDRPLAAALGCLALWVGSSPMRVWPGRPAPLGASVDGEAINIAVFAGSATSGVEVCFFDASGAEERIDLPERSGGVWHGAFPDIGPGTEYG